MPDLVEIGAAVWKSIKLNSVALVRERSIPTERLWFFGEVGANFCR
jgi:hypothetical protein